MLCEVFTAVTMKNAVFEDFTPCVSCKNRRSEEHIASIIRVITISELLTTLTVTSNRSTQRSTMLRLLVTANVEEWRLLGCYAV
jgi:hypothetical protein